MKILSAEFELSAYSRLHYPARRLPEIAFLGRSNVGKSSLLNSLLQRRGLARTSNTPGRTQSINFFRINDSFYFVDLPGYGFARVSKTTRADWGKMAEEYLAGREELVLSIQLVDSRHEPSALDRQLNEWLLHYGQPHVLVATKADKLSRNELSKHLKLITKSLPRSPLMAYSSETGYGRDELWAKIAESLENS